MRIAVVGNAGGGKTTLSRRLAQIHHLPLHHVDSIQFTAGLRMRPHTETAKILEEIHSQPSWIIDGYGPLQIIEKRFALADTIVFVDLPLWRHYSWIIKRQLKSSIAPRPELPEGCNEATLAHTLKIFKTMWRMHQQMRPELLRIFDREANKSKVVRVTTVAHLNALLLNDADH